jgi:uncharacterized protein YbjT (DUF2867 family)
MFVVTGVSGHTGSVVAKTLAERRQKLRVVVRDAAKGARWKERGAEVAVASVDNPDALTAALRGAEGVYAVVPPNYGTNEMLKSQKRVVDAYALALEATRPRHVVLLSSVGAQLDEGTGPIKGLHYAEEKLGRLAPALTAVRAAYFMENWASLLAVAKEQSILPAMLTADRRIPMVATADIGRVAAEALLEGPSAKGIIDLGGPQDYSPADVALILSKLLGRDVRTVDVPDLGIIPALKSAGFTDDLAGLFREMIGAINQGRVAFTQQPVRGEVALEAVLRQLLGR